MRVEATLPPARFSCLDRRMIHCLSTERNIPLYVKATSSMCKLGSHSTRQEIAERRVWSLSKRCHDQRSPYENDYIVLTSHQYQ